MGITKIKKNYLFVLILMVLISCKENKELSTKRSHPTEKEVISTEEFSNLIESSKEFELKHNEIFQEDLISDSKQYYDKVIDTFVDEEMGFFRIFAEMWDYAFRTDNERKLLWKLKIERYFRTTSFLNNVRNEVTIYTDGVNNQRKNGLTKILGTKHSSDLKLDLIVEGNSFNVQNETVDSVVKKINEEIIDQFADIPLDSLIVPIIFFLFSITSSLIKKFVGIAVTICCCIFFFIRSNNRQSEMKDTLKTEVYEILNNININYLGQLNKNTNTYYTKLEKVHYEK